MLCRRHSATSLLYVVVTTNHWRNSKAWHTDRRRWYELLWGREVWGECIIRGSKLPQANQKTPSLSFLVADNRRNQGIRPSQLL
jgi:hypothetical protein